MLVLCEGSATIRQESQESPGGITESQGILLESQGILLESQGITKISIFEI